MFEEEPKLSDVYFDNEGISSPRPLLCGIKWNGIKHTTFTFREMTGADEEAISKGELRNNPAKIIHVLLERCVKSIGTLTKKDIGIKEWSDLMCELYVGDQDWILFTIRAASLGREFKISHFCPNQDCKAKLTTYVDCDELAIKRFKGEEEIAFELPRGYRHFDKATQETRLIKQGFLRLSKGEDREILTPVFRKNPGLSRTMMLTRLVTFLEDNAPPLNDQIMKDLTTGDRNYLTDLLQEHDFGIDGSATRILSKSA